METLKLYAPSAWPAQSTTQKRKVVLSSVNPSLITVAALIVGNLIGIAALLLVYVALN